MYDLILISPNLNSLPMNPTCPYVTRELQDAGELVQTNMLMHRYLYVPWRMISKGETTQ